MNVSLFLSGMASACFFACGTIFYRNWLAAKDRFFLFFALACILLGVERVIALFVAGVTYDVRSAIAESVSGVFLMRLAAFALITCAIVAKNRKERRPRQPTATPPRGRGWARWARGPSGG
jgi:hypothetical protein